MYDRTPVSNRLKPAGWFCGLLRGTGSPVGDYFAQLSAHIAASAPLDGFDA